MTAIALGVENGELPRRQLEHRADDVLART